MRRRSVSFLRAMLEDAGRGDPCAQAVGAAGNEFNAADRWCG